MSAIIEQIIHLDAQIYSLRHKPRKTSTTVEQIRALETRVRRLWHERRVELAGLDCHLYDYEDAFGKAHMADFYHVPGRASAEWRILGEYIESHSAIDDVIETLRIQRAQRWQRRQTGDCVQMPLAV